MGNIKIHEIAKKYDLSSKDVIKIANKLGIEAKSHLSSVSAQDNKKIEASIAEQNTPAKVKTTGNVIIRREVIITDEEVEEEKKREQEEKRKREETRKNSNREKKRFQYCI